MAQTSPTIQTMGFTEARQQFSQLVNRVFRHEERVLIEKHGLPVAAIVSADDLRRLNELDSQRAERFAAMREISEAFADVPLDELEAQIARVIAEGRARYKAERDETEIAGKQ